MMGKQMSGAGVWSPAEVAREVSMSLAHCLPTPNNHGLSLTQAV